MTPTIRLVCATRENRKTFFTQTALGRSLAVYRLPFVNLQVFGENRDGLSKVYNRAIRHARSDPATLVFVHDDVTLCDFYWYRQLQDALQQFAIVGVVGNKRRADHQAGWAYIDDAPTWDQPEHFSGGLGRGNAFPPEEVIRFGEPPQQVKLLDGLLLAAESRVLIENGLEFDEQFDFHFYDVDFCRQAEAKGLSMGTCAVSVIHGSGGAFDERWRAAYSRYLEKWGR